MRTTNGSGAWLPEATDYGVFIHVKKNNYLTSVIQGEINGGFVTAWQGYESDVSGFLFDVAKVGANGGALACEFGSARLTSTGLRTHGFHSATCFLESDNVLGGYGYWAEGRIGQLDSGILIDTYDDRTGAEIAAGAVAPVWGWIIRSRRGRSDAATDFGVQAGGRMVLGLPANRKIIDVTNTNDLRLRSAADDATLLTVTNGGQATLLGGLTTTEGRITLGSAYSTVALEALAGVAAARSIYYCSDGDAGQRCLAVLIGGAFYPISIGATPINET